ncbi:MAG: 50S ribosomal protein L13 [Spirochaetota bacterium]
MKTYTGPIEQKEKKWYIIDARGKVLGRVATRVASILRGKHRPDYSPSADMGACVIVINADKIRVTGAKQSRKMYYRHSGYPGGIKGVSFSEKLKKDPCFPIWQAVKGMLPKNRLGRKQLQHLKVYAGENHPHEAQQPEKLEV